MKRLNTVLLPLLLVSLFSLQQQVYGQYVLSSKVVSNGGVTSNNSDFHLEATVGQPAAGVTSNTDFQLNSGFWYGFDITIGAPTATAATYVTDSSFTANWDSVSGATGYRLDVSTSITFNDYEYKDLDVGNTIGRNVAGLSDSTSYYYQVRAYNSGDTSSNSNTITVTTNVTSVEQIRSDIPLTYALSQNYPNPFNPTTTIQFALPKKSRVTLKLFDMIGREVVTLIDGESPAGEFKVLLGAGNLPSGVYFYRLETRDFVRTRKLTLLK